MSAADPLAKTYSSRQDKGSEASFSALSRTLEDLEARLSRLTSVRQPGPLVSEAEAFSTPAHSGASAPGSSRKQALAAAASELAMAGSMPATKQHMAPRNGSLPQGGSLTRSELAHARRLGSLADQAVNLGADTAAFDMLRDLATEVRQLREEMILNATRADPEPFELLQNSFEDLKRMVAERAPPETIGAEIYGIMEDLAELTATNADQGSVDALRAELDAMAGLLDVLAREDTILAVSRRWDEFENRLTDHLELDGDAKRDLRTELERLRDSLGTLATEEQILAVQSRWNEFEAHHLRNAEQAERSLAESLRNQLEQLRERIDSIAVDLSADALDARFAELEERISPHRLEAGIERMSARIGEMDQVLSGLQDNTQLDRVEQRVVALAKGVEVLLSLQQSPDLQHFATLEERLDEISAAIVAEAERNAAVDPLSFGRIENRIESLAARVDALADDEALQALTRQVAELSARIEEAGEHSAMEELSNRVAGLSERFDAVVLGLKQPQTDEHAFEARLAGLVSRIENAPTPRIDDDVIKILEAQIAKLSEHLDDSVGTLAADTPDPELGRRLMAIEQRLEESRDALLSAARDAAEEALRRTQEDGLLRESEHVLHLASDLKTLESLCRDTDRRSASEFDRMQSTLVKIVDRLTTIERELVTGHAPASSVSEQSESAPAVSSDTVQAADPRGLRASIARHLSRRTEAALRQDVAAEIEAPSHAEPVAPIIPSLEASDALMSREVNRPMVPGSGTPDIAALLERVRRHQRGEAVPNSEPLGKADVITAARKAAAAAAAEAASLRAEPQAENQEAEGAFSQSLVSRSLMSRRRKPILMAVGAVLLALLAIPAGYMFADPGMLSVAANNPEPQVAQAPGVAKKPGAPRADLGVVSGTPAAPAGGEALSPAPKIAASAPPPAILPKPLPILERPPEPQAPSTAAVPEAVARPAPLVQPASMMSPQASSTPVVSLSGAFSARPAASSAGLRDAAQLAQASGKLPVDAVGGLPAVPAQIGPDALVKAVADGDRKAMFEVGLRLMEGRGGAPSAADALVWFMQSAAKGFAPAQYSLGTLYEKGNGVPRDTLAARDWYTLAADQGNVRAMHNLAVLYATGIDKKSDPETAARWFTDAADRGMRDSQYNLGILYARGAGVDTDLAKSFKWFSIVAASGDKDAAAKRDEIAKSLSAADLAKAQASVVAWKPLPRDEAANTVEIPTTWNEAVDRTSSVDMKRAIRNVQAILIKLGYQPGTPDGLVGAQTVDAIRAFQQANGLAVSGEIDEALIRALLKRQDA